MFEKENNHEEDQMELYNPTPSMSLKFAMPPVAQVCTVFTSAVHYEASKNYIFRCGLFADILSPSSLQPGFAQQQTIMPIQTVLSRLPTVPQH
jgi:hypothetical protein